MNHHRWLIIWIGDYYHYLVVITMILVIMNTIW
jgi:hypothetical protein